ncbi:hypothetical protein PG994_000301 [Apiospora phragmitis]|uniref:Uncharacterized protein n=1 Tax=Apiospora phragmitis TaxID=2905665 RepID=A0ABR1X5Y2_9PEZI
MHSNQCFLPVHHCEEGLARYGYLVLGPGSSLLTLVQARINASPPPRIDGEAHGDDPDGLMADLEYHLGNVQTEYIEVRLSYSHSGFPTFNDIGGAGTAVAIEGVSQSRTHLETRVTGVITRNNPMSAWSPRPTPCAPVSNTLFAIIAAHWGPIRANDIMHRIIASRSTPRKVAVTTATSTATTTPKSPLRHRRAGTDIQGSDETVRAAAVPPERTATAPPLRVPRRQTSLRRGTLSLSPPKTAVGCPERPESYGRRCGVLLQEVNRATTQVVSNGSPDPRQTISHLVSRRSRG